MPSIFAQYESLTLKDPFFIEGKGEFKEDSIVNSFLKHITDLIALSLAVNDVNGYQYINNKNGYDNLRPADLELKGRFYKIEKKYFLDLRLHRYETDDLVYPAMTRLMFDDLQYDERTEYTIEQRLDIWLYTWFQLKAHSMDIHRKLEAFEKDVSRVNFEQLSLAVKEIGVLIRRYFYNNAYLEQESIPSSVFEDRLAIMNNAFTVITVVLYKLDERYEELERKNKSGTENTKEIIHNRESYYTLSEQWFKDYGSTIAVKNMIDACSTLKLLYQNIGDEKKVDEMEVRIEIWNIILDVSKKP